MIGFPPCTHLCSSGARWWKDKKQEQEDAIKFVLALYNCGIPKVAIENPVGILSTVWRKPDCIVQPYEHGHGETKKTCLWLKNLPVLKPSNPVSGREQKVWKCPPGPNRWKIRSKTYQGIADCMANTWG